MIPSCLVGRETCAVSPDAFVIAHAFIVAGGTWTIARRFSRSGIVDAGLRIASAQGFWSYLLPFDIVLSASAIYEIIEWLVAGHVDPQAGLAFLGIQGDIWDAQKDILAAMIGALIALSIVALINWRYDPGFVDEMKQSLKIPPADQPAGRGTIAALDRELQTAQTLIPVGGARA